MAGLDKTIWIIANWKSNKTISEALDWIGKVGPSLPRKENLKIVVCPTFSMLSEVKKAITVGNFPLMVGSQDLSPFEVGAYTGEEAAGLIHELVNLSILGHSERRQNFGESDELIERKVQEALSHNIIPLVCVQDKQTPIPKGCKIIAYEPVWAIGSGHPDTPENTEEVAQFIKNKYSEDLDILYGGSVTAKNVAQFINQTNISGVLIGNASLDANEFVQICQVSSKGS